MYAWAALEGLGWCYDSQANLASAANRVPRAEVRAYVAESVFAAATAGCAGPGCAGAARAARVAAEHAREPRDQDEDERGERRHQALPARRSGSEAAVQAEARLRRREDREVGDLGARRERFVDGKVRGRGHRDPQMVERRRRLHPDLR